MMKLHGIHWVGLLILMQLPKKIEGRSLFTKVNITTSHELPTKLVDHLAYEMGNRAKGVEDQQKVLNSARNGRDEQEVIKIVKNMGGKQKMTEGANNAKGQQEERYSVQNIEDQQEVAEIAKDVVDQMEVAKRVKIVEEQQGVPIRAQNVEDQQEVPKRAKNVEDQQEVSQIRYIGGRQVVSKRAKNLEAQKKVPEKIKDLEDQQEVGNGANNLEDHKETPNGEKTEPDQQDELNKAYNVEDQQEVRARAKNAEDLQKILNTTKDVEGRQEVTNRASNVKNEQKVANGAENIEYQQELHKRAQNVGMQQNMNNRAQNEEYQWEVPNRAKNVEDQQKNLSTAKAVEDQKEISNRSQIVEEKQKVLNRAQSTEDPLEMADGAKNAEDQQDVPSRPNNMEGHNLKEIMDELLLKSQQKMGDKALDGLLPFDFYNKTKPFAENETNAKYITKETINKGPIQHGISAENYETNMGFGELPKAELVREDLNKNKLTDDINSMPNEQQRHAAISPHIYSSAEEDDDHPFDRFSLDIKNIGNNETLKDQLDFLQNNAENIKRQQDIADEGDVDIMERNKHVVQTHTTSSGAESNTQEDFKKTLVHEIRAEIDNNKIKVNQNLEQSISAGEPIEFNEEAAASYTSELASSATRPYESLSYPTDNSSTLEEETKKLQQNVSTATGVVGIELQIGFKKPVIQLLVSPALNNKVNHISSSNESLELPKPLRHPSDANEQADDSFMSEFDLGADKTSTNQYSSINVLSSIEVSTQKSRIADATAATDADTEAQDFKESTSKPFTAVGHNNKVNYSTLFNESFEVTKPLRVETAANEYKLNTSLTTPNINFKNSTITPQLIDFKNTSDTKVDAEYLDSYKTAAVSELDASELLNYANSPQFSASIVTVNAEDVFSRLTEIFDEYSIPIASVVKQLSVGYERTPVERTSAESIEPTKLSEYSYIQATEQVTQIDERPDAVVDSNSLDAADSEEYGYGSGYTILQSQANFANYVNISSSAEQANSEEVSAENQAIKTACSEEEYGKHEEIAAAAQLMEINQQSMVTDYQSDENVESEESEYEVDEPSITEEMIVNAQTTKSVPTKATTSTTLPLQANSQLITNDQTNYLEYMKVAIEQFLRKEIENIDKTNESQVESIHTDHSIDIESQLPAESTNDMPTWETTATGLQHINTTHWSQEHKHGIVVGGKREQMRVQMPEVMCSKTGIIKSEQYNKTNENGNEIETEVEAANENENKIENGTKKAAIPERVLLGRSVSYTLSCHIKLHDEPETITPAVCGTNDTIGDGIDNLQQKTIKNHEQLTITSADERSNTLQVLGIEHEHAGAETIITERKMGWHTAMGSSNNTAYKADGENSDEGVVEAVDGGSGNYVDVSTESSKKSAENYYGQRRGIEYEIYDSDANTGRHEESETSLPDVGIQSRVRHTADVTTFVQSPINFETDNDKTYEYSYYATRRQPLQGDGVVDKEATQTSVAKRMATGVNSENTTNSKPSDDVDIVIADEHVTHDYERDNSSDGRDAAAMAGEAAVAAAYVGKIDNRADVHVTINVDGFSQMSHLNRPTDESDISNDDDVEDDDDNVGKLHFVEGTGAEAIKSLKIDIKSTELENVSAKNTVANNNAGDAVGDMEDDNIRVVDVDVAAEAEATEAVEAVKAGEAADMADVNWGAANADADADVSTIAVAYATKANTPNDHSVVHAADIASKADITTTNWWHTLSSTEISTHLNGDIFSSKALPSQTTTTIDEHLEAPEIARKSEETQSAQPEVAEGVEKLSTVASRNFDGH